MFETFYLGTPEPNWLGRVSVPLIVSKRKVGGVKTLPRALGRWALDSGGFSELSINGSYSFTPKEYVSVVRRVATEIGNMDWAAIMDWMCEDIMLKKTGLSIQDHQRLTCESYDELTYLAPEINWVPVLQGKTISDYLRHVDMYTDRNVDLSQLSLVGVGSVCRRQKTIQVGMIFAWLKDRNIRMHGFGVKSGGLNLYKQYLVSADSHAWSLAARYKNTKTMECTHKSPTCTGCLNYALRWREEVLSNI